MKINTEKELLVLTCNFPQVSVKSISIIDNNLCEWGDEVYFFDPVFTSYQGEYKRYFCLSRVSDFDIEDVCGWFVESPKNEEVEGYFWCK